MNIAYFSSPIGTIELTASTKGIRTVRFLEEEELSSGTINAANENNPHLSQALSELDAYFSGKSQSFSVALDVSGTNFQSSTWSALQAIPYGQTQSYGTVASYINKASASRAVGNACNRNNVPLLIPCHRVVGSNGNLHGFACGLWRKAWLLEHEKRYAA